MSNDTSSTISLKTDINGPIPTHENGHANVKNGQFYAGAQATQTVKTHFGSNGSTPVAVEAAVTALEAEDADTLTTIAHPYAAGNLTWEILSTTLDASTDVPYSIEGDGVVKILDASDLAAGTDVINVKATETDRLRRVYLFEVTVTVS